MDYQSADLTFEFFMLCLFPGKNQLWEIDVITLKQLAELSNLSVRTVRRALSNHPYVAADKRELVLKLAEQYQYTPNMAARNLRLQRKNFVGILFENYTRGADSRLLNMLTRELVSHNFWPLLGCIDSVETADRMFNEWSGVVDHVVILHEVRKNILEHIVQGSARLPMKFIYVDCMDYGKDYSLKIDRPGGVFNMVSTLAARGIKHLIYCGELQSRRDGIDRAIEQGLPIKISSIKSPYEFENGLALGKKIMESRADAVFFDTDRMAMGFYRYCFENQIVIPDDISVVGFNDELFAEMAPPPLSTLAHPRRQMVESILNILQSNDPPPPEPMPMQFICRESLKTFLQS